MTGRSTKEWVGRTPDTTIPARVKIRVFEAHGGVCALTGRKIRPGDDWDCDHIEALVNGGENRESNLQPALRFAHREKTKADVAKKAKNARVKKKHRLPSEAQKSRNPLPGGRGSKFKKKVNGEVVRRD